MRVRVCVVVRMWGRRRGVNVCVTFVSDRPNITYSLTTLTETGGDGNYGGTVSFPGMQNTLSINFICDPSAGIGQPTFVNKPNQNEFLLEWKSQYGCPNTLPPPPPPVFTFPDAFSFSVGIPGTPRYS